LINSSKANLAIAVAVKVAGSTIGQLTPNSVSFISQPARLLEKFLVLRSRRPKLEFKARSSEFGGRSFEFKARSSEFRGRSFKFKARSFESGGRSFEFKARSFEFRGRSSKFKRQNFEFKARSLHTKTQLVALGTEKL
jgi:hypothetical protein